MILPELYLEYTWIVLGLYSDLPSVYTHRAQVVPELYVDCTRMAPGLYPDCTRIVPGLRPDYTWIGRV